MSHETTIIDINDTTTQEEAGKNIAKKAIWKKATIGAGVGILLGMTPAVASALWDGREMAPNYEDDADNDLKPNTPEASLEENHQVAEVAVATAPNIEEVDLENTDNIEEISFSQAFNEARQQYGPGHSFEWNGHTYSTFTENEWDNLTDSERTEQCEQAIAINADTDLQEIPSLEEDLLAENPADVLPEIDNNDNLELEVGTTTDDPILEANITDMHDDMANANDELELDIIDSQTNGLDIIDLEYDSATGATLAEAILDGQEVVLVDIDGDGMADHIVLDPDNNNPHYLNNWQELDNPIDLNPTTDEDFELNDGSVDYASDF